ncbi:MAG: alkene reductase [Actinobacteria bacterium]|nr:alkene reductase [Actinomycetota bacterium]
MPATQLDPLLQPLQLGQISAANRVFMAPLTRSRATDPDGVPTELMAQYYAQRASAGLIVSEATNISPVARGYAWTPGIYTQEQIEGWQAVTAAVHEAGGRIVCQLWHTGRVSHESLHPGQSTVSSSAKECDQCQAYINVDGIGQRAPTTPPRALSIAEIDETIADYATASTNAINAGFDGVEIHSANGYLLQQFISPNVNDRDDQYGGDVESRVRFTLEAVDAAIGAIGAGRVGVRISPLFPFNGIDDPNPGPAYRLIGNEVSKREIAFLHIADTATMAQGAASSMPEILALMGDSATVPVVLNGAYDAKRARDDIASGAAAAIAFGRAFLANPDLPRRLAEGLELNEPNPRTFYGGEAVGYTDYPSWSAG